MVEQKLPKLTTRVRFPSPAPALLLVAVAALALPEPAAPDFASGKAVLGSVETMVKTLKPLAEGAARSWQAIRAAGKCAVIRTELEHSIEAGAYNADNGEQRWRECAEAYRQVP